MGSLKPQILIYAHLADSSARLPKSLSVEVSERIKGFALLDQKIAGEGTARAKAGGNGLPLAKIARPADQRYASSAVHSGCEVGCE